MRGRPRRPATDADPDLFWALRGGGGNLGVVTSFTYRLRPVAGAFGGLLGYTMDRAVEALEHIREVSARLPDQLGTVRRQLVTAPPAPFVPDTCAGSGWSA